MVEAVRISFVVPVYGVEAFVGQCLRSILVDPGSDFEVIAVDDASPDRSGAILDAMAADDPRLTVRHLPANVGLGRARNAGLAAARGDYVWFVDSDDWLRPGAVNAVRERLAATDPDVLIIGYTESHADGRELIPPAQSRLADIEKPVRLVERPGLLRLLPAAWAKVVRRAVLDEHGLRFPTGWYEDCAYHHRLLMAADSIDALDRPLYHYRQRPTGQITASRSDRHFEVFAQYEAAFAAIGAAHEEFRGELFALMIDHLLIIAGNDHRLPARSRRRFFHRIAGLYQAYRPNGGYPVPDGLAGLRHRLVQHDLASAYLLLRRAYRLREASAGLAGQTPASTSRVRRRSSPARTDPGPA